MQQAPSRWDRVVAVRSVLGDSEIGRKPLVSSTAGMPGHSTMTRVTVPPCLRLTPCTQPTVSVSLALESIQGCCQAVNVALTLSVFQTTVIMDGVEEQAVVRHAAPLLTAMLDCIVVPQALQALVWRSKMRVRRAPQVTNVLPFMITVV